MQNEKEKTCTEASQFKDLNKKQIKAMDETIEYLRGTELTIREAQEMLSICSDKLIDINFNELKKRGKYFEEIPTMPVRIPMAWLVGKEEFDYDFIIKQINEYKNKYYMTN